MRYYKRIDITVDEETLKILKSYDRPVSATVREAVKNYFKFNRPKFDENSQLTYENI